MYYYLGKHFAILQNSLPFSERGQVKKLVYYVYTSQGLINMKQTNMHQIYCLKCNALKRERTYKNLAYRVIVPVVGPQTFQQILN